jgi:hypothetical protein
VTRHYGGAKWRVAAVALGAADPLAGWFLAKPASSAKEFVFFVEK